MFKNSTIKAILCIHIWWKFESTVINFSITKKPKIDYYFVDYFEKYQVFTFNSLKHQLDTIVYYKPPSKFKIRANLLFFLNVTSLRQWHKKKHTKLNTKS